MLYATEISGFLNTKLFGADLKVNGVSSINQIKENTIIFISKFSEDYIEIINNSIENILILCVPEYENKLLKTHIIVKNARLTYANVVSHFFTHDTKEEFTSTVNISKNAVLGKNVTVLKNSIIEDEVRIGDNVQIGYNVVIKKGTIIGDNCFVKSNTVIGEEGFGFERDKCNVPIRVPHMGRVVIGKNVEIGSLNSICRGTIEDTIIGDNVKLSDQVHVAHNVVIKNNSMLGAGVRVNGSALVNNGVWLSPNSTIMNNIKVGSNAVIGLGAVVINNVDDNAVVAGNPAKLIRKLGE